MKYKQFFKWCNERVCDGRWGIREAIVCIDIVDKIRYLPFWKREKKWQEINNEFQIEELIKLINITNK